ncbi:hypothetical protein KSC_108350 [Ktedonobacter sp. SOSP1-52]|uniref:DUF4126 domain-containing protein n=1 Tax=Ktedonobacter sp. SOSP1-52 TaxID=2778366 RepID=UPI001914E1C6|nr:DUF4126 domain-containing protein [Ktedonobacter sp. SOSP1-52]GHO71943.1 hypothetical protein KSC_108350 [Ktedonobacter sp. SOSP1-52]
MDVLTTSSIAAGLAFLSGINAYLPLLIVGILAQFHLVPGFRLNPEYAFLANPITLVLLAVLTIFNFVVDKIPGASAIWNAVHTFLRPIAGALVAGAVGMDHRALPLVMLGAVMATLSHTTKMGIRTSASAVTGGGATPILGLAEDVGVGIGLIFVFVAPLVVFYLMLIFLVIFLIFAPSFIGAIRYQWRVMAAFLATRPQQPTGPLDFLGCINPTERALFAQTLLQARPLAGVELLWHRRLTGRGLWGKRRVALPTWFVATDKGFLLFPPSQSRLMLVVPFASVRSLDFKQAIMKGSLQIQEHSGQKHEFTVLRTQQRTAEQLVAMVSSRYHFPSTVAQKAPGRTQASWLIRSLN